MGAHWNTQKYIKIHHNTRCIVMYFDVFLRIPMGSHHNTATIRVSMLVARSVGFPQKSGVTDRLVCLCTPVLFALPICSSPTLDLTTEVFASTLGCLHDFKATFFSLLPPYLFSVFLVVPLGGVLLISSIRRVMLQLIPTPLRLAQVE